MNRKLLAIAVAVIACTIAIIRWLAPDGTITVDFKNAPLSKVIAAIEHQGRVQIATNLPGETPVTLKLQRAPVLEALETLAVRVDGDLRPSVITAPTMSRVRDGIAAAVASMKPPEDWVISFFPGGFAPASSVVIDARIIPVSLDPKQAKDLQTALREVSGKSGLLTATPKDWNPAPSLPGNAVPASRLAQGLAHSAHGKAEEVFLIIGRPDRSRETAGGPPGGDRPGGGGPDGPGGGGWRGWNREQANPDWAAARVENTLAQLPPEERAAAKANFDSMQAAMKEFANLTEDQRRAKMADMANNPEVQKRFSEGMDRRDTRSTPEQRAARYQNYIERKVAAQAAARQN